MKFGLRDSGLKDTASHPARGAWIEIRHRRDTWRKRIRRTPQGVRGLKCPRVVGRLLGGLVAPRKGCVD